jgi:cytochrome c
MINISNCFKLFTVLLVLPVLCTRVAAQTTPVPEVNRFTKVVLAPKLEEPMQFQVLNDGRVLYAERKGKLKVYDPATGDIKVIADIPVSTEYVSKSGKREEGEDGLQGVILDPDYEKNHWIYLYYSVKDEVVNSVVRYKWDGGPLILSSAKTILKVAVQREECCHVGGGMLFDAQKNLLLSTGDNTFSRSSDGFTPTDERPGESPRDAQKSSGNTNDLRGKILRIHPETDGTYTIPAGNLFAKGDSLTRPEIYIMGNRNPWRLTIDSKTGWLYWGEVGPDGSDSSPSRGPRSYDEFNMAKKAGNYGWPYFIGNNQAYRQYDFATKKSGELYDAAKPENNSPNNKGRRQLPPAVPSMIWYPYATSDEFPLLSSGGRSAVGGPIFHADDFKKDAKVFPAYYEGKWFITDWVRGWIIAVTLDEEGQYKSMERFLPDLTLRGPIDMKFGPNGNLYILEYGNGYFKDNPEAELIRIEYNAGNRTPVVQAKASKTAGALPLKVSLSSARTVDYDKDFLKYQWKIKQKGVVKQVLKQANPVITLTKPGIYQAVLTVTDSKGASNSQTIDIAAGNEPPAVGLNFTKGNSSFFFPGNTVDYKVSVSDKEDGSLANKRIPASHVSMSVEYLSDGYDYTTVAQGQNRTDASAKFAAAKAIIAKSDCNACHSVDTKSLGPAFRQVALKYKGNDAAQAMLVKKVIAGGSGVWGDAMMPAHSALSETQVNTIVKYILSLDEKPVVQKTYPLQGSYTINADPAQAAKGNYVFRAAYTDKGTRLAKPQTGEKVIVLRSAQIPAAAADIFKDAKADDNGRIVEIAEKNAFIGFAAIDLTGIKRIAFTMAGKTVAGKITVRIQSPAGKIIGESGADNIAAIGPLTGKYYVYFIFSDAGMRLREIKMLND